MMKVKNPTAKSKAVRDKGGLVVIKPGKTVTITGKGLSKDDVARYEAAGLQFGAADEKKEPEKKA